MKLGTLVLLVILFHLRNGAMLKYHVFNWNPRWLPVAILKITITGNFSTFLRQKVLKLRVMVIFNMATGNHLVFEQQKITFQPGKSQKWIQCPWIIWNRGITLTSETKSTYITRNGNFQYGHWQPSWISAAKIKFQPYKSQKWIQCPWFILNGVITLASETKSTKITRNGNFQYGHWQPSWISVVNMIFQCGFIS